MTVAADKYTYDKNNNILSEEIFNDWPDDEKDKVHYEYTDYGQTKINGNTEIDNEICYTGAVYDDTTRLYYMNARYYSPEDGRFISQDSYRGEKDDPGQWHLYTYCANNLINYADPSGYIYIGTYMELAKAAIKVLKKAG